MTIIVGSATVPSNSTVAAFTLPAGLCNFTLYQPTQPQVVYVGTSSRVSTTSGLPVPVTPLAQESYVSTAGATYYATTGNGTASSFQYIICSAT
jgi:hypothetical protein